MMDYPRQCLAGCQCRAGSGHWRNPRQMECKERCLQSTEVEVLFAAADVVNNKRLGSILSIRENAHDEAKLARVPGCLQWPDPSSFFGTSTLWCPADDGVLTVR